MLGSSGFAECLARCGLFGGFFGIGGKQRRTAARGARIDDDRLRLHGWDRQDVRRLDVDLKLGEREGGVRGVALVVERDLDIVVLVLGGGTLAMRTADLIAQVWRRGVDRRQLFDRAERGFQPGKLAVIESLFQKLCGLDRALGR